VLCITDQQTGGWARGRRCNLPRIQIHCSRHPPVYQTTTPGRIRRNDSATVGLFINLQRGACSGAKHTMCDCDGNWCVALRAPYSNHRFTNWPAPMIPYRLAGNLQAASDTLSEIDCARGMGSTGLLNRSLQTRKFRISRPRSPGTFAKLARHRHRAQRHHQESFCPRGVKHRGRRKVSREFPYFPTKAGQSRIACKSQWRVRCANAQRGEHHDEMRISRTLDNSDDEAAR
jgi:hypothetical protein